MYAIGNDELGRLPRVAIGDAVRCKDGHEHILRRAYSSGAELLTYTCGKEEFICAVDGHAPPGVAIVARQVELP